MPCSLLFCIHECVYTYTYTYTGTYHISLCLRVCWTMHNIIQSDALTVLFYHLVIDVASHEEVSFSMVEFSGTVSLSLEISVSRYFLSRCT